MINIRSFWPAPVILHPLVYHADATAPSGGDGGSGGSGSAAISGPSASTLLKIGALVAGLIIGLLVVRYAVKSKS